MITKPPKRQQVVRLIGRACVKSGCALGVLHNTFNYTSAWYRWIETIRSYCLSWTGHNLQNCDENHKLCWSWIYFEYSSIHRQALIPVRLILCAVLNMGGDKKLIMEIKFSLQCYCILILWGKFHQTCDIKVKLKPLKRRIAGELPLNKLSYKAENPALLSFQHQMQQSKAFILKRFTLRFWAKGLSLT